MNAKVTLTHRLQSQTGFRLSPLESLPPLLRPTLRASWTTIVA